MAHKKIKGLQYAVKREVSLFDTVYNKQTKGVKVGHGIMQVFYEQVTTVRKLNKLKRKGKK